jgi:hypothetical protein
VPAHQTQLFVKLAEQGVFRLLIALDATLRKLPGGLADAASPKHLTLVVCEDNPDV